MNDINEIDEQIEQISLYDEDTHSENSFTRCSNVLNVVAETNKENYKLLQTIEEQKVTIQTLYKKIEELKKAEKKIATKSIIWRNQKKKYKTPLKKNQR